MALLASAVEVDAVGQLGRRADRAAHRVPQQIHVGRMVHVGLHAERVDPPVQRLAGLFSGYLVPRPAGLGQKLRAQKRDVVDHGLLFAGMPECRLAAWHPAHRAMLAGRLGQLVESQPSPCSGTASTRVRQRSMPGRPAFLRTAGCTTASSRSNTLRRKALRT